MKKLGKSKILIFGKGQIGTMYDEYFRGRGFQVSLTSTDIRKIVGVKNIVARTKPDIVINAAAKTNLEWVEKHKLEAFNVNVLGADNITEVCEEKKLYCLHLSSGCIFESESSKDAKKETDIPNPAAFYSWTKVWAENLIMARKSLRYLIIRPRQPVSSEVSEKNMLIKMLTFSKFVANDGGWNSGTVLEDLMWITEEMIAKRVTGVFHVTNEGWTTPYKIALLLRKHINPDMGFEEISHAELDRLTPVKRVATVLDIGKLKLLGIEPRNYEKRLEEIIIDLKMNLRSRGSQEILRKTEKTSKQRTKTASDWETIFN